MRKVVLWVYDHKITIYSRGLQLLHEEFHLYYCSYYYNDFLKASRSHRGANCSTFHGLLYTFEHTLEQQEGIWAPTNTSSPASLFSHPKCWSLLSWLNDFPLEQQIQKYHLKSLKISAGMHCMELMQRSHLRSVSTPDAQTLEHLSSHPVLWSAYFSIMRTHHMKCERNPLLCAFVSCIHP